MIGATIWAIPGGKLGRVQIEKAVKMIVESGFDGVDLSLSQVGDISLRTTASNLKHLKAKVAEGPGQLISVSTLLLYDYPLTSVDTEKYNTAVRIVNKMMEIASYLEIPTISISPGTINSEDSYIDCYNRSVERVSKLAQRAEQLGVTLCIENVLTKFLVSPKEMKSYLSDINSRMIGFCLDCGNCQTMGYPSQWIEILGPWIRKVHVTDVHAHSPHSVEFVEVGTGDVEWEKVVRGLKEINYKGPLISEIFYNKAAPYMQRLRHVSRIMRTLENSL